MSGEEKQKVGEVGDKLLGIVHRRLDVPGLVIDINKEIARPALKRFVDDTSTPFEVDNILFDKLYPKFEQFLEEEAQKVWDGILAKSEPVTEAKPGELV